MELKVRKYKQNVDLGLYVMRRSTGYVAIIGMMALVQTANMAIFFQQVFLYKTEGLPSWLGHTVALILGICAGIVIETAAMFCAVNQLRKASWVAATIAALLSLSSYHQVLYADTMQEYMRVMGVVIIATAPPLFIVVVSHTLSHRLQEERIDALFDAPEEFVARTVLTNQIQLHEESLRAKDQALQVLQSQLQQATENVHTMHEQNQHLQHLLSQQQTDSATCSEYVAMISELQDQLQQAKDDNSRLQKSHAGQMSALKRKFNTTSPIQA